MRGGREGAGDIWSVCMCFMQSYDRHILYYCINTDAARNETKSVY